MTTLRAAEAAKRAVEWPERSEKVRNGVKRAKVARKWQVSDLFSHDGIVGDVFKHRSSFWDDGFVSGMYSDFVAPLLSRTQWPKRAWRYSNFIAY